MQQQDRVKNVFAGIVEKIVEYERKLAQAQDRIRQLESELEKYKKENALLRSKSEALAKQLEEYNKLADGLFKLLRRPDTLRTYARKKE